MPDLRQSEPTPAYLLPSDGLPFSPEATAYPLDLLLENLGKLPVEHVTVILDACFSGNTDSGTGLAGALSPGVSATTLPPEPEAKVSVLAATGPGRDQFAAWLEPQRHGAFTWHLLQGLYGKADRDSDGRVTLAEAARYTRTQVRLDVRQRPDGLVQTPTLRSDRPGHELTVFDLETQPVFSPLA